MSRIDKTKGQLAQELEKLRLRIAGLLKLKVEHRQVKEHLKLELIEHRKAERALHESEEKYRNLVERANDGIVIIQDGIMKYLNPRLAEMGGYTVQESTGTTFTDYLHPAERPIVIDRYNRRLSGENV